MTREEREKFTRTQIFSSGSWEDAVQAIVDKWEADVTDNREEAFKNRQENAWESALPTPRLPKMDSHDEHYEGLNGDKITVRRFTQDGEFAGVRVFVDGWLDRSYETEVGAKRLAKFLERVGAVPVTP